jgi:hypothetical protein
MSTDLTRHNRPVSDHVPSIVYKSAAGAVLLFVTLAWIFFGGWAQMGLLLTVVSGFFFMTLAIPFALWLTWRRHRDSASTPDEVMSSREWASGEFVIWQDHLKGTNAAVEILLPIAATAVGMLTIGIVFYVVSAGSG